MSPAADWPWPWPNARCGAASGRSCGSASELLARQFTLEAHTLGTVGGDRLRIELTGQGATGAAEERGSRVADALDVSLADLRHTWDHGLARALGVEHGPDYGSEASQTASSGPSSATGEVA